MRKLMTLVENFISETHEIYNHRTGDSTPVYRLVSMEQLTNLLSRFNSLRGMIVGNNVYVWNARDATHLHYEQSIGDDGARIGFVKLNDIIDIEYNIHDIDIDQLKRQPKIKMIIDSGLKYDFTSNSI